MTDAAFASAQAAYEAPPDVEDGIECPDCKGAGEMGECANDGTHGCSHQFDREWVCRTCGGAGTIAQQDHPDWCDRCGLVGDCPECDPRDPREDYDDFDADHYTGPTFLE